MLDGETMALREFIELQVRNLELRFSDYMAEHRRYHQRLADQLVKDEGVISERLLEMNRLREQLNSERNLYVTRDMMDNRARELDQRLADLLALASSHNEANAKRILELEKSRANTEGRLAAVTGFLLFVQVVFSVLSHFWK